MPSQRVKILFNHSPGEAEKIQNTSASIAVIPGRDLF
jgi:hypothetical protein